MASTPSFASADAAVPLSRDQIVASSSGWLAVSLNLCCNGSGYIYQRRWGAFWLGGLGTAVAVVALAGGGALIGNSLDQGSADRSLAIMGGAAVGFNAGLLAVGVASSVEAGLAVNRARRRLKG